MVIDVFQYSNQGGRDHNEDAMGCIISDNDNGGIFVVADGLGGHSYGELASEAAVDILTMDDWIDIADDVSQLLENKISEAHKAVMDLQIQKNTQLKTTIAALAIYGENAVWANVGDSRVYFIHNNRLHSYTEDHSVAYMKYKAGEITREQLSTDEDQSRLLRALGNAERNEPSLYNCDVLLRPGDAFFLCTDGAWELLSDEEILIDFLKAENARQWSELLMIRMMERIDENHDNLTLMTVILE